MSLLLFNLGYSPKANVWVVVCLFPKEFASQKIKQVKKLLANVDVSLSMIKTRKRIAAHSLAKFSLLALLIAGIYCYTLTLPVSKTAPTQEFKIEKGESVKSIASRLKSERLLRSPLYSA
jgi:hypothetical protein